MSKCIYCKWTKICNQWVSECANESCENFGEECIEKVQFEKRWGDDKEVEE